MNLYVFYSKSLNDIMLTEAPIKRRGALFLYGKGN